MNRPTIVIVQARLSSNRLPGKALLPIQNIPIAVLAAKRAGNTGLRVRVATSNDRLDVPLAKTLRDYGVEAIKGPLDDVLRRFVLATNDLSDDALIVRLTADNVFPDGDLIDQMITSLNESGRDYVGTGGRTAGLPYGLSAEAFSLRILREADKNATAEYDREHVTPWIRRQTAGICFRPEQAMKDISTLRCTIDSLDDYCRVNRVFDGVPNPVSVSWLELCERLSAETQPKIKSPITLSRSVSEMTLGTAQLGLLNYGRTNKHGRPDSETAIAIVRKAVDYGVCSIDTARSYDCAEYVIGKALKPYGGGVRIVTKLEPLEGVDENVQISDVYRAVDASVFRSCRELGVARIPTLLLHRWRHFTAYNGAVWRRLRELKKEGVIETLGASVSNPSEAAEALGIAEIEHLQIPFNLIDTRWGAAGIGALAKKRPDMTIYARSVLLQGILAARPQDWPRIGGISPTIIVNQLDQIVKQTRRANRVDLCIAFVRAQPWIDSLVMGVETPSQLEDLVNWFEQPPLDLTRLADQTKRFSDLPESLLNPALWPYHR